MGLFGLKHFDNETMLQRYRNHLIKIIGITNY